MIGVRIGFVLRGAQRHGQVKGAALIQFGLDPYPPLVEIGDRLDDGQSQSTAVFALFPFLLHLIKLFKQANLVFRGDAGAKVLHAKCHFPVDHFGLQFDGAGARRILNGIG